VVGDTCRQRKEFGHVAVFQVQPNAASTAKLFTYINQNKFNPQTFNYMPDELLPVSKTPFAWVLFDRFEPIKESAGK
jgi:hypothetical protein